MKVGVVVVAAGSGQRLGSERPKALVALAGRPLLVHALAALADAGLPAPVVVHGAGQHAAFVAALAGSEVAALVPGGATRTASVRAGVEALPADVEVVAVHDAVRPLTPPEVLRRVTAVVAGDLAGDVVAAAPGLPVADTLKRTRDGEVVATVDRHGIVGIQTPQVFPRHVLEAALAADDDATDDLALVERLLHTGALTGRIVVVPGSLFGHKVTYPEDLALVEALASST